MGNYALFDRMNTDK